VQGVARYGALGSADDIGGGAGPAAVRLLAQGPYALLVSAVAVVEVLVEHERSVSLAALDHDMEALDDLAIALLEHAPGVGRAREVLHEVELRPLRRVTRDVRRRAPGEHHEGGEQEGFGIHRVRSRQVCMTEIRPASNAASQ